MNLARLYPEPSDYDPYVTPYEVEANLPPAVRRDVRLSRIAAYEQCPALAQYIPGERIMLEFDR